MKLGDVVESAIWMDGTETTEQRKSHDQHVTTAINRLCEQEGFICGPITFLEKKPGGDRVPSVPKHIEETAEDFSKIRMLIAESTITKKMPATSKGSFVANLEKKDLKALRKITRKAYAKSYGMLIGNTKCDEIIEALGPDAALETLRTLH